MNHSRRWALVSATILMMIGASSWAQTIPLNNLESGEFKDVVRDFSAVLHHSSVSGAGTLGTIFGFEVGLVGGITKTPGVNSVVKTVDPDAEASQIPHGELLGVLTVPAGVTVEAGFIPKVGGDDFKFGSFSAAVKWTPTELFFADLPFSLAVKGQFTSAKLEFKADVGGVPVPVDYTYDSTQTAFTALISKNFMILEPYFGIGMVSGKGELSASTAVFTSGEFSSSESVSSMHWMVGTEVKLLVFKLGVEYANLFDTHRYTGKLAFYF